MKGEDEKPGERNARHQLQRIAAGCAQALSNILPDEAGIRFAVILFDIGDSGCIANASNAERDGVTKAMKTLLEKILIEGEVEKLTLQKG